VLILNDLKNNQQNVYFFLGSSQNVYLLCKTIL